MGCGSVGTWAVVLSGFEDVGTWGFGTVRQ